MHAMFSLSSELSRAGRLCLCAIGLLLTGLSYAADDFGDGDDFSPPEDYIPLFDDDDTFLDPVTQYPYSPLDERAYRYRVSRILAERDRLGVSLLHEDFPLIPGCVPLQEVEVLPAVDRSHHMTSRGVCIPGQWVDNFFADETSEPFAARTLVRAIYFSRWEDGEDHTSGTRIDGQVSLNNLSRRLSLVFRSDDKDDDLLRERVDIMQPDDRGTARAAIRFATALGRQASSRTDVGMRGSTPFVRTRFRYNQPLFWGLHGRVNQEFYLRANEQRRGVATEFQLGRRLTDNSTLRATSTFESNTALRADGTRWQWSHSVSHFWRIAHRKGLQTLVRVDGDYRDQYQAQSYQYSLRYRSSVWRPWVYYEIEPFALQMREHDFRTSTGIMLRFEVQLGDYH